MPHPHPLLALATVAGYMLLCLLWSVATCKDRIEHGLDVSERTPTQAEGHQTDQSHTAQGTA
jgi:hypothetical protein